MYYHLKDDMSSDQDTSSSQGKPNKEKKKRRGFNISFSFRKNRQKQEDPRATSSTQTSDKNTKKKNKKSKGKSRGGRSPRPSLWRSKPRSFSSSSSNSSSSSSESDLHTSSDSNRLPQSAQSIQPVSLAGNPLSSTSLPYAAASGNSVQQFGIPEKEGNHFGIHPYLQPSMQGYPSERNDSLGYDGMSSFGTAHTRYYYPHHLDSNEGDYWNSRKDSTFGYGNPSHFSHSHDYFRDDDDDDNHGDNHEQLSSSSSSSSLFSQSRSIIRKGKGSE